MTELEFRQEYYKLSTKYTEECNQINAEIEKLKKDCLTYRDHYFEEVQHLKERYIAEGGHI